MIYPPYLKKPIIVIPIVMLATFALYAPENWISSANWLSTPVDVMGLIFPPIIAYTQKSAFPGITQAYMTFSFALIPLHFWFAFKELKKPTNEAWHANLWRIKSYGDLAKRACLVLLMCCLAFITLFLKTGYDFNLLPVNSSRIALARLAGYLQALVKHGCLQGYIVIYWFFHNL
jgi:hypothetical protein